MIFVVKEPEHAALLSDWSCHFETSTSME